MASFEQIIKFENEQRRGAASLGCEWQAVTEENKAGFRFFKVEVVLP